MRIWLQIGRATVLMLAALGLKATAPLIGAIYGPEKVAEIGRSLLNRLDAEDLTA